MQVGNGFFIAVVLALTFPALHFGAIDAIVTDFVSGPSKVASVPRGLLGIPDGDIPSSGKEPEVEASLRAHAKEWRENNEAQQRALSLAEQLKQDADAGDTSAQIEYAQMLHRDGKSGAAQGYLLDAVRAGSGEAMSIYASWYEQKSGSDYYLAVALCWYWLAQANGWVDQDGVVQSLEAVANDDALERANGMMHAQAGQFGILALSDKQVGPSR